MVWRARVFKWVAVARARSCSCSVSAWRQIITIRTLVGTLLHTHTERERDSDLSADSRHIWWTINIGPQSHWIDEITNVGVSMKIDFSICAALNMGKTFEQDKILLIRIWSGLLRNIHILSVLKLPAIRVWAGWEIVGERLGAKSGCS